MNAFEQTSQRPNTAWIDARLEVLQDTSRCRRLRDATIVSDGWVELGGRRLLNLCSNDYLGFATESVSDLPDGLHGGGSSRLIIGNHPSFGVVERQLAALKGCDASVVFGSGYAANTGIIPALIGRGDAVFGDRLNHASIIDGVVLSRAKHFRYRHGDAEHLAELLRTHTDYRRRLIVTESVFSMDGTVAPLAEIAALSEQHAAMVLVDEAHSGGIYGDDGAGLVNECGVQAAVDIQMGTFSKAYGRYGAYACGTTSVVDYLVTTARSLIYSTALPPLLVESIADVISKSQAEPWRRKQLRDNGQRFRRRLVDAGLNVIGSAPHIVPLVVGDSERVMALSRQLEERGIAAIGIRPPTVPDGSARLRFSLTALHRRADLDMAAETIIDVMRTC